MPVRGKALNAVKRLLRDAGHHTQRERNHAAPRQVPQPDHEQPERRHRTECLERRTDSGRSLLQRIDKMTRKYGHDHLGERREHHRERDSSEQRLAGAPMFQCERQHVAKGLRALRAKLSHV